ncbi:MAG: hypothetical protein ACOX2W_09550 [Desulfomonilia bacterium]
MKRKKNNSNKKIFIIPGRQPHLLRLSKYLTDDVCGILIHEKKEIENISLDGLDRIKPDRVFTRNSLTAIFLDHLCNDDKVLYEDALRRLLSDARAHYLASRSSINSAFNNSILIERVVVNSISIIRKTNPSCLISSSTPHSLEAWILAKCFEYIGLPVYILERTPIIDRAWVYCGMDTQSVVLLNNEHPKMQLAESTKKIVREQRDSKPGSRDKNGFPISRLNLHAIKGANKNRWWSYKREFLWLISGKISSLPLRFMKTYLKFDLYKSYSRVSEKKLDEDPFITYFMHYQPERTSLPEGLSYAQQWNAIRLISWALPEGWTLYVREHPTIWLRPLDFAIRTKNFYDDVSKLRNVKVCPMDIDTFELIDKSIAVATLTGKVGFQAILRNKPVLAFGLPAY